MTFSGFYYHQGTTNLITQGIKFKQHLFVIAISLTSAVYNNMANAAPLATVTIKQVQSDSTYTAEGIVEAIKTSAIAPQVTGNISALNVKVGDIVKAGQLLARIDTRIVNQQAASNKAQVAAAQAQLSAARKEYERKSRLYAKEYISQAAMERAESDFKTAEAQTKAQLAQFGMSNVETNLHTISAPYAGIVAEVLTEVGGMAMPGQPMLVIYDPSSLRATVNVPQSQLNNLNNNASVKVLVSSANDVERELVSTQITVLPTADAISNMSAVRLSLPMHLTSVRPGMFARAQLPVLGSTAQGKITVPTTAVIKRSELVAVYVLSQQGKPQLRQVRLGRKQGVNVQVLAGLKAGDVVALDPIAAANMK
ncbi:MAG TPA: efflux RND transporter periplasmic adaptor subunit [Methylotenera sp.]|nr:efflux RND transporter periplasmic adaptor subunit [Methylotenera sp.]HPN01924.1 efflux RND transporter periplasmic adaptor subunit [Methylotenera sp.]